MRIGHADQFQAGPRDQEGTSTKAIGSRTLPQLSHSELFGVT